MLRRASSTDGLRTIIGEVRIAMDWTVIVNDTVIGNDTVIELPAFAGASICLMLRMSCHAIRGTWHLSVPCRTWGVKQEGDGHIHITKAYYCQVRLVAAAVSAPPAVHPPHALASSMAIPT